MIDLLLSDVFVDNVRTLYHSGTSKVFMLTSHQRLAAKDTYHFYDLWVKDPSTGSWGDRFGTTEGGNMHNVMVGSHLTRVFKVVRVDKMKDHLKASTGAIRGAEEL